VEEIARVYAESLFAVAKEQGQLDRVREELAQFSDVLEDDRQLQVFFFSPYFHTAEKREGMERAVSGASEEFMNFLGLLIEKHRMPVIFRIRRAFEEMWKRENRRLDVTLISAVELDPEVVRELGAAIEKQTGRKVELQSNVDDGIVGGLVLQVGNMVLDASIRNRLEKLRKSVAQAAQ
jgi:F-type H+-transporting ATPase subunit delta